MESSPPEAPAEGTRTIRLRAMQYLELHELKLSIAFFLGGFVFDVVTLGDIDDPLVILQQVVYLILTGGILFVEYAREGDPDAFPLPRLLQKPWLYRSLVLHFLLGSLFSVYSLFFLKSASIFSSVIFVALLLAVMVANELKSVQKSGLDIKVSLFSICVYCFFLLVVPLAFGRVGWLPFLLATFATVNTLALIYRALMRRKHADYLKRRLALPGLATVGVFLALYFFGWIPPVPLSAVKMGVYHRIEKPRNAYAVIEERPWWKLLVPAAYFVRSVDAGEAASAQLGEGFTREPLGDHYVLYHERPWWKFWQSGDQVFTARAGDKIHLFVAVFSPGRFADTVFVRWQFHDAKNGWQGSDRIPVAITGGRKEGFRGFTAKSNYDYGDGSWRVSVETSDGREIGRIYFEVTRDESALEERKFNLELY